MKKLVIFMLYITSISLLYTGIKNINNAFEILDQEIPYGFYISLLIMLFLYRYE